jgi:hypothetical protein
MTWWDIPGGLTSVSKFHHDFVLRVRARGFVSHACRHAVEVVHGKSSLERVGLKGVPWGVEAHVAADDEPARPESGIGKDVVEAFDLVEGRRPVLGQNSLVSCVESWFLGRRQPLIESIGRTLARLVISGQYCDKASSDGTFLIVR